MFAISDRCAIANVCNVSVNQTWLLVNQMICTELRNVIGFLCQSKDGCSGLRNLIDFRCQSILPLQCRNPTLQDVRIWLCITAYCFWALRNSLCHSSMVCVPGCIASYDRCALVMPYALVHDLTWPLLFGNILCFDAQFECDRCAWIVSVHWHITVRRAPMPNWALCTVA